MPNIPPAKQIPSSEAPKSRRGRSDVYPWDLWLKPGVATELIKGQHFHCTIQTMAQAVRDRAQRAGIKVTVNKHPNNTLMVICHATPLENVRKPSSQSIRNIPETPKRRKQQDGSF